MKKYSIIKNIFLYIIFLTTVGASSQKIAGKIQNGSKDTKLLIRTIGEKKLKEIELNNNTFITDNLNLKEGYYILRKGNDIVYVFLKSTDDLTITFDANKFVETISFSGKGAKRNNYLVAKRNVQIEKKKDLGEVCEKGEKEYHKRIKEINTELLKLLDSSSTEKEFKSEEKKNIKYGFLHNIFNYKNLHKYYLGKDVTPTDFFLKPLKEVDFNNSNLYNTNPSYRNLTSSKWKKDIEEAKNLEEMNSLFRATNSNDLKRDLLISFYYAISTSKDKAKDYYKLLEKYIPNTKFVAKAKQKLKAIQKTSKGKKTPNFSYKDVNGKEISLDSFRGKYVVIDVWATWCTPCLGQIPHLKRLEHKYENKNIVFIGISVDRKEQYNVWKEMIKSKELKNIQLFADNSFDSEFIKSYSISSIPRFILISPDGKIVENNMSKPSQQRTEVLLDKLLN